jgi:hypothetical protein
MGWSGCKDEVDDGDTARVEGSCETVWGDSMGAVTDVREPDAFVVGGTYGIVNGGYI